MKVFILSKTIVQLYSTADALKLIVNPGLTVQVFVLLSASLIEPLISIASLERCQIGMITPPATDVFLFTIYIIVACSPQ